MGRAGHTLAGGLWGEALEGRQEADVAVLAVDLLEQGLAFVHGFPLDWASVKGVETAGSEFLQPSTVAITGYMLTQAP